MARKRGVSGWHGMRKADLIAALAKAGPLNQEKAGRNSDSRPTTPARRLTATQQRLATLQQERLRLQDLSTATPAAQNDQLVLLVRDPYWLQVNWEITPTSVKRARTTLGQHWHGASPVLRVGRLGEDGAVAATRQVKIHGGVSHWYVDVSNPPSRYRVEIGYVDIEGEFYSLARSNEIQTPEPGSAAPQEHAWSDVARHADQVYAMSGGYSSDGPSAELRTVLQDRLRRPLGRPNETRIINGAGLPSAASLHVDVDADLVLRGTTNPHAHLTIRGEPIDVREDGSFAIQLPLPDRRQVIPIVASSADGLHQRTIILGVERNTKALEPRRRDPAAG